MWQSQPLVAAAANRISNRESVDIPPDSGKLSSGLMGAPGVDPPTYANGPPSFSQFLDPIHRALMNTTNTTEVVDSS
jgi:hypothetical protein